MSNTRNSRGSIPGQSVGQSVGQSMGPSTDPSIVVASSRRRPARARRMLRGLVALTVMLGVAVASTSVAHAYTEQPVTGPIGEITAGDPVTIGGTGFDPDGTVFIGITLISSGFSLTSIGCADADLLGTSATDGIGTWSFTFSAPTEPGTYLVISCDANNIGYLEIVIAGSPDTTDPTDPTAVTTTIASGGLPLTGSSGTGAVLQFGVLVVGVGAILALAARRLRPSR